MHRWILVLALAFWAAPLHAATTYTVSTTASPMETVVAPFRTPQSDADFYGLFQSEANPPFALLPETMHVYLHQQDGADEVSIGVIFNTNTNGAATTDGNFIGSLSGALDSARGGVEDDGSESFGWSGADPIDGASSVNGRFALTWTRDFTDGFTFYNAVSSAWTVLIAPEQMTGITQTVFLHGDPGAPQSLFLNTPGLTAVQIRAAVTSVPLPASGALLFVVLAVLAARGARRGTSSHRASGA